MNVLAGRLNQLAGRLRAISGTGPAAGGEPAEMMPVRSAIDALEERPASPTAADRAALYLLNDTERLDSLLRRTNPATMTGAERVVAARLAMAIQESSATLAALVRRGRPAVPSQPGPPGRPGRRRGRVTTRASRGYRAVAGLLEASSRYPDPDTAGCNGRPARRGRGGPRWQ